MSPEQARGSRDIDVTTDLYALGVILYEFLTGKVLFDAEVPTAVAVMHITDPVPPIEPRDGLRLPQGFESIVRSLLAKAVSMRTTPKLKFIYDDTLAKGQHLTSLIDEALARDERDHQHDDE